MTGLRAFRGLVRSNSFSIRRILAAFFLATLTCAAPLADAQAKKRIGPQSLPQDVTEPLTIVISLRKQRLHLFDANGLIASSPISSGRPGYRTPKGIFTILQKRRQHFSNLYGGAPMPNMQRLTWSGIALHAGNLPGYPDSHGCIRLPHRFSKYLFDITKLGGRVIVTDEPVTPVPISHPALLKPLPAGGPDHKVQTASLVGSSDSDPAQVAGLLLAVNQANAAEASVDAAPLRTRASIAEARAKELLDLETALAERRAAVQEIGAELKEANLKLRSAIEAVKKVEAELAKVRNQIAASKDAEAATVELLRDFMKKLAGISGEEALLKAAAEEEALEAQLLDQITAQELALKDQQSLEALHEERRRAADSAKEIRDDLLRRHVEARKAAIAASAALDHAKSAAAQREKPITVLLSKKTGTMYVRQGYDDILEAPIAFSMPEAPVGTHVFTALDYTADGNDLRWHVVTAATRSEPAARKSAKAVKAKEPKAETAAFPKQTAAAALDRVMIPQHVRDQLAEHIKPGSSIIITDEGKSYETGKYTDLIVEFR